MTWEALLAGVVRLMEKRRELLAQNKDTSAVDAKLSKLYALGDLVWEQRIKYGT